MKEKQVAKKEITNHVQVSLAASEYASRAYFLFISVLRGKYTVGT